MSPGIPIGRILHFAGLGYTPAVDSEDPSGITWAAGLRGFSRGRRHRGLVEVGLTQLVAETSVTTLAGVRGRRLYGPSAQLGYQYASLSGLTALLTFGGGYTLSAPVTGSRFQPALGLGWVTRSASAPEGPNSSRASGP